MSWYAENNFAEIAADNRSIVIAFANMLKKFDTPVDPVVLAKILTQDEPQIDLWSIASYMENVQIHEVYTAGDWPHTADAIVKFHRMDPATAGQVDHYCLVADANARSIIDSLDGVIKSAATYGEPQGYVSYFNIDPDEEDPAGDPEFNKPGTTYKRLKGESIYDVSRKLKIPVQELLMHNALEDRNDIPEDFIFHLPVARPVIEDKPIVYEVFEEPQKMHISREMGAHQWAFGNARDWKDLRRSGPMYARYSNLEVVALARVPIGDDIASYYMTAASLGEYEETRRVKFNIGFNHNHLAEGHVDRFNLPPPPVAEAKIEAQKKVQERKKIIADIAAIDLTSNPNFFKSTYRPFDKPVTFFMRVKMTVQEVDGRAVDHTLKEGEPVVITGMLERDGDLYGRCATERDGYWFIIPANDLLSSEQVMAENQEIHDAGQTTPAERAAVRRYSGRSEEAWATFSRNVGKAVSFKRRVKNEIKKAKE